MPDAGSNTSAPSSYGAPEQGATYKSPMSLETDHALIVDLLLKPGEATLLDLTPEKAKLLHIGLAIASEAGEIADAIKKHCIYGKPLDRDNVIEELGDQEFFLHALRETLKITREETLQGNIAKLSKRYASGSYSNAQAIERADKAQP